MAMERKDFAGSFRALLFVIEHILPILSTGFLVGAALITQRAVPDAGLSHLFSSPSFMLALIHSTVTQMHSKMFVISLCTLYRVGPSRAHLLRATFVQAVATLGGYVFIFWPLFRRLDKPCTTMLDGGAVYLGGRAFIAVVCLVACAAPALKDTSDTGFGAMRRRLAPAGAVPVWVVATGFRTLLDCSLVPLAVLTATTPSQVLAAGTAINVVLCGMVVVVIMVAQPVVTLVVSDNYRSAFPAARTGENTTSDGHHGVKLE